MPFDDHHEFAKLTGKSIPGAPKNTLGHSYLGIFLMVHFYKKLTTQLTATSLKSCHL